MVMMRDYLGNAVSSVDPSAIKAIDDFVGGFLGYEARAEAIIAGAEACPGDALVNAYAGVLNMLREAPAAPANAARYLAAADAALTANPREKATIEHLRAWMSGDMVGAMAISRRIVEESPRDLAMVKLHQYHAFNLGDFPEMLRVAEAVLAVNADIAQMHGMHAFALEQCHLLAEAEAAARKALSIYPDEPWAHHALAHVMITQGRIDEGADFMSGVSASWAGLNSFMYTHNWWHLALFYLSQGKGADALAIYDEHVWTQARTYSQDQIGAVSLLARLEFAGLDVGGRWDELSDYLAVRVEDTVQPFLSLQYLYGLARAGRSEAATLMTAIRRQADEAPAYSREAWAEVALPAAEAILDYLTGDHDAAVRKMGAALPRMIEIGGSHAQRDLFEQIRLQAILGAHRWGLAQQILEQRRGFDPNGVPLNTTLARVYTQLGLPRQAERAIQRAKHTLSPQAA